MAGAIILLANAAVLNAEPLRIVYTAITPMYGPLWVTQETGIFKKNNLRAQQEGFAHLADVAAMGRPYVYGTVAARESFAQRRPDLMNRFARAFVEGIYRFKFG